MVIILALVLTVGVWCEAEMITSQIFGPESKEITELTGPVGMLSESLETANFIRTIGWLLIALLGLGMVGAGAYGFLFLFGVLFSIVLIAYGLPATWAIVIFSVLLFVTLGVIFLDTETATNIQAKVTTWWQNRGKNPSPADVPEKWTWWDESRQADNKILDELYRKEWEGKDL